MNDTAAALLIGLIGFALIGPGLCARVCRRAGAGAGAAVALLTMVGLVLLPLAWLACLAGGGLAPGLAEGCRRVLGVGPSVAAGAGVGVLVLAALARHLVRSAARAERAVPRGLTRLACPRLPLPGGGAAWVLPSAEPLAYVSGLRDPQVVVSQGLLSLLSERERQAVLAHEAGHLRLGHTRLLVVAHAFARTFRWMPGVGRSWTLLRRALEIAADDEARRTVDPRHLQRALARIAVARGAGAAPAAGFNDLDPDSLRHRLECLRQPPDRGRSRTACAYALALIAGVAWTGCVLIAGATPTAAGVLACALPAAWVALRPTGGVAGAWHRYRSTPSPPRPDRAPPRRATSRG